MPSLIDLRRRIQSVKNTQQITKAMKMVSAAKLRRAQQAVINSRPYSSLLDEMIGSILANAGEEEAPGHPLLERRPVRNVQLLVLAGEKGLCGSFNSNVFKAVNGFVDGQAPKRVELELLGRKATEFFRPRGHPISGSWEQVFAKVDHVTASRIAERAMERFASGDADEVWVLYNSFRSVLRQEVVLKAILPVLPAAGAESGAGYDYEQPPAELLAALLPNQVVTQVFVAMLESAAAEHAARMTAMDAATRNAGEVLEKLTLHLNRVRQASITTEIIEIVSGASALE